MVLKVLNLPDDKRVLVDLRSSDDAGIFLLDDNRAIVATVDFFPPIVDDPYLFGQISSANALSDVYAMGATPLLALSISCFPPKKYKPDVLCKVIQGAIDKCDEAKCALIGGHTLKDEEMKFGLSVVGVVSPDKVVLNSTAKPGDALILTKPLGIGLISTALKAGKADDNVIEKATEMMLTLNKVPAELMVEAGASAATDITGFGLIGHSLEMARSSIVGIRLYADKIPYFSDALEYAKMGLIPGGLHKNAEFSEPFEHIPDEIPQEMIDILHCPETSGGLLISIEKNKADRLVERIKEEGFEDATVIGEVVESPRGVIEIVP